MKVYQAINLIQADLAKTGIEKNRKNHQGSGYNFRGIDDVYNALAPLLATHNLCVLPRMLTRNCDERLSKSGGSLFYVTIEAEFDFVSSEDGSKHTVKTYGEAMDSGDKATSKAMSAAYKYAAFMAFAIPTEGDNDPDAQSYEVLPEGKLPLREQVKETKIPPAISDQRLLAAIAKIKSGEYTTDKLRASFRLTGEQNEKLISELANA
jgi:hypothetical protein